MNHDDKIILFQEKQVRRIWHDEEWYFAIPDVLEVLTNTKNPKQYWKDLKKRDPQLEKGGGQIATPLLIATTGGKQKVNCANTEGVFRIIMSVPSPNAEPFKLWLAQVGKERVAEIENPEIGFDRLKEIYRAKGYSDEWIDSRLKSIDIRKQLTTEWKKRGVSEGLEYSILTAEISKATFGLTPSEYQRFKGLEKQNLRDHMTNLELIFTMLGEESTRMTAVEDDAQGFEDNHVAANKGGTITGNARKLYEKQSGRKVVSPENFLKQIQAAEQQNTEGGNEDAESKDLDK
jgi:DNA-damage-inducible protein D